MESLDQPFHSFCRLPVELQRMVWRYCLPPRVIEVDAPVRWDMLDDHGVDALATICTLRRTTWLNQRPPLITRVCRLSRSTAFEVGSFVAPRTCDGRLLNPKRWPPSRIAKHSTWKDRAHDSLHLNWTLNAEWENGSPISPFEEPERTAETIIVPGGSGNVSLMMQAFVSEFEAEQYDWYGFRRPRFPMSLQPHTLQELNVFQMVPEWLVVMRTIIVHCDLGIAARTGLFGLLGDAPVVVVDACRDEARVRALLDFAQMCESKWGPPLTRNQNFERVSPESMKRRLDHHIQWRYHSEGQAAVMHPAVMFRLCPSMCNRYHD